MTHDHHDDPSDQQEVLDPLDVVVYLEDTGAPFAHIVAAYLEPEVWRAAQGPGADPADVTAWVTWVATVARIGRGHAYIGHRAPADADTVTAVTEIDETDLLISAAEQYGRDDIADWLRAAHAELHATGPDGRPLIEHPTGVSAVVVHLTDRAPRGPSGTPTTRRTS